MVVVVVVAVTAMVVVVVVVEGRIRKGWMCVLGHHMGNVRARVVGRACMNINNIRNSGNIND
jgi:hypothetical protein